MELDYSTEWISQRTAELYDQNRRERSIWADVHGQWSLLLPGFATLGIGIWRAPALVGAHPGWLPLFFTLLVLGGLLTAASFLLVKKHPGHAISRYVIATTQMVWAMGLIPITGGQPESYLFVFLAIAMLSFYRDWTVLVLAAAVLLVGQIISEFALTLFAFDPTAGNSISLYHWIGWNAGFCLLLGLFGWFENQKLRQQCLRQSELEQSNKQVEQIAWDRTKELKTTNRHLKSEVKSRVKADSERERLMRKLIHASREADRSEVATGALQAVGATVNSLKYSLETILEQLNSSRIGRLEQAIEMLNRKPDELAEFLTNTDRGRQLPEFFQTMAGQLNQQITDIKDEVLELQAMVSHVAEIVLVRQPCGPTTATSEAFSVADLCDEAIRIERQTADGNATPIERNYGNLPTICSDRLRIKQIIVDLLRHARESSLQSSVDSRKIQISTAMDHPAILTITVANNGIGMEAEHLRRVFQPGFKTGNDGRGLGLHSSLLMAHDLNGTLECVSTNKHQEVKFVLTVPIEETSLATVDAESCSQG